MPQPSDGFPAAGGRLRAALAVLVAALLLLGMAAVVWWELHPGEVQARSGLALSQDALAGRIHALGAWGVAGSIGLMVLHSFVPFPAELLAIANGMVYGTLWGSVVTWVGAMLGAWLAFGCARWLGRPFVGKMVSARHRQTLDRWSDRQGGEVLLLSRLVPLIAFNLINYAAGLTAMSWWTFTWATGLGILPLTVLMALLGERMLELTWWVWALVAAAVLLTWAAIHGLRRAWRRDQEAGRSQ